MNSDLTWQSDFNGYEVGFDDVEVVGCYSIVSFEGFEVEVFINAENKDVLGVSVQKEVKP